MTKRSTKASTARSHAMLLAAYYLARCGEFDGSAPAKPPASLNVSSWKDAYNLFFDTMSDGRDLNQFQNSLKNARDTFDYLFENGREGWKRYDGSQNLPPIFQKIHEQWHSTEDSELEDYIINALLSHGNQEEPMVPAFEARNEGGTRVFMSVRRERDPYLRAEAIRLHGTRCMACDFDFSSMYGEHGDGFIEVHHCTPLSAKGIRTTDPRTDLIVLCSNCHRMMHRKRGYTLSLAELCRLIRKNQR